MLKGLRVRSRDGFSVGETTGGERRCRLEGCGGTCIAVRWPKGRGKGTHVTYPCLKGMTVMADGGFKII